jgi:hypothetical protein
VRNPPPARNPTNAPTASEGTTPHLRRSTQSNFGAPPPRFSPQFNVAATLADEAIALSDTDRADGISRLVELNAAPASNPDLLDYDQAMRAPDADLFKDGMKVEISLLIKQDTFDVVPKQEAKDAGQTILPGTWAFRRKRSGDGTIKKHKMWFGFAFGMARPAEPNQPATLCRWTRFYLQLATTRSYFSLSACSKYEADIWLSPTVERRWALAGLAVASPSHRSETPVV